MSRIFFIAIVALCLVIPGGSGKAARDLDTAALAGTQLELVVLEVEGCLYCQIFRRDVVPAYRASPRAAEVPMRFLDLNDPEAAKPALSSPVDVVPTVVVLHNNREVGRISGYVGPETFFHSIDYLLFRAE